MGLAARKPVDLGSRCTVFMNSSVKQAQKDGADVTDISAGLSISVVKNALYKVIRCSGPQELGQHIVVQGGTFLNDAVLRAFENELGVDVVRPDIAGLMGAYGAALHAMAQRALHAGESTVLSLDALNAFTHSVKQARCGLCENHCRLTVNDFGGGRRFISGNRCDRPVSGGRQQSGLNLYAYKQEKLLALINDRRENAPRGTIGLPMGLNMYELLPFWHALFTDLGFDVAVSPFSSRKLYIAGQATIPSDTVCFPAKLMHGHVDYLIEQGVKTIFYPCMSYNMDEHLGDNHYNCPVVAYYPEVIAANMPAVRRIDFIHDYVGIDHRKVFPKKLTGILQQHFPDITAREVRHACDAAYAAYDAYMNDVRAKGEEMIEQARREGRRIIVLVGRPYHVDPEINHGIDKLIAGFGAAVVTEDSLSWHMQKQAQGVLNQWPAAGARRPKRKEGLTPMPSNHVEFTREMREAGYTILVPNMLEFHFSLIVKVLRLNGYNAELLTNSGPNVMAEGLKYVHNDTCVPALLVIGQFLDALHSGKYDINKVALIITQTGGGCRASNYIYLLRKALKKAGLEQVPVISVNMSGLESASGFKLTVPLVRQIIASLVYGDCIMCVSNQTRPYESKKGTTDALIEKWNDALIEQFNRGQGLSNKDMRKNLAAIVDDFDAIERSREKKTRRSSGLSDMNQTRPTSWKRARPTR